MTKIKIVYGAPLSGKTTYVKERLNKNDLVFDYDDIMQSITGMPYQEHNRDMHKHVMSIRELLIDRSLRDSNVKNLYIITTFISKELMSLDAKCIKMSTDFMTVMDRCHKSERDNKEAVKLTIIDWFQKYASDKTRKEKYGSESNKKTFYNSATWRNLRQKVIERDNGECQECKRLGNVTVDSIKAEGKRKKPKLNVHHIMEIEYYPELALEIDNLITVCVSCHNRIHNKMDNLIYKSSKWQDERW